MSDEPEVFPCPYCELDSLSPAGHLVSDGTWACPFPWTTPASDDFDDEEDTLEYIMREHPGVTTTIYDAGYEDGFNQALSDLGFSDELIE